MLEGTRFVLADTEKLHQKIAAMSDRIRQLEDGLAILQSAQTRDTHPLFQRDLLKTKSIIELHAAGEGEEGLQPKEEDAKEGQTIDAFGTLAIRDDGAATFYGRSAGQESLLIGKEAAATASTSQSNLHSPEAQAWSPNNTELPASINSLSSSFPFSPPNTNSPPMSIPLPQVIDLDLLVNTYLPSWLEVQRLGNLYLEQAPWFFGAVTRRQLEEEVLPTWSAEAPQPTDRSLLARTPHDLALLFILLTFGAMTDAEQQASNALAEK
ncbi:hypothetical protein C0991_010850 [Blastosporella zonata]|nr:hypothetical protein C0991_010850 [Blastosporella zonata]